MQLRERLIGGAAALDLPLEAVQADRLLLLIDELERWNRSYNLTGHADREAMLTHHLLDSLAIHGELAGERVADVGTGAGFPGLPLAIVRPTLRFTLIDSSLKKLRFVEHAVGLLGLTNVEALHARVELLRPAVPFDTVLVRAFAALPELLAAVRALCGPQTRVLAMKGRQPDAELAGVGAPWCVAAVRRLEVPGLGKQRHLVTMRLQPVDSTSSSHGRPE